MKVRSSLAILSAGLCATILGLSGLPVERASACAMAGRSGGSLPRIDAEQALIVWDSARRTEHFIRQADFYDAREEFAFLVPTPSRPELGEVDSSVFRDLERIYVPRDARRGTGVSMGGSALRGRAPAAVTVVEQRRVAGLDATVLAASDAGALAAWLGAHGFAGRAGLDAWLAPYVRDGFYVTTFRYVPDPERRALGAAVRLSFETSRPFYPYAEPADAPQRRHRRFVLSVVSDARVAGAVGASSWSADVLYAGTPGSLPGIVRRALGRHAPARARWLTTFEERSSNRGADDLVFERSADQSPVRAE